LDSPITITNQKLARKFLEGELLGFPITIVEQNKKITRKSLEVVVIGSISTLQQNH